MTSMTNMDDSAGTRGPLGRSLDVAFCLAWLAAVLMAAAIIMPFVTLQPSAGSRSTELFVELVTGNRFTPMTLTLLGGIVHILGGRDWPIGVVLLSFSVLFPMAKLVVLFSVLRATACPRGARLLAWIVERARRTLHWIAASLPEGLRLTLARCAGVATVTLPRTRLEWLELLGPWSMADVLVVAVSVLLFKDFPGGSSVSAERGFWVFLASVIAALLAVLFTKASQCSPDAGDAHAPPGPKAGRESDQHNGWNGVLRHYAPPPLNAAVSSRPHASGAVGILSRALKEFVEATQPVPTDTGPAAPQPAPCCTECEGRVASLVVARMAMDRQDGLAIRWASRLVDWLNAEEGARQAAATRHMEEVHAAELSLLRRRKAIVEQEFRAAVRNAPLITWTLVASQSRVLAEQSLKAADEASRDRVADARIAVQRILRCAPTLPHSTPTSVISSQQPPAPSRWIGIALIVLCLAVLSRCSSALGSERAGRFPTPSTWPLKPGIQWRIYQSGPSAWAESAAHVGGVLLVVASVTAGAGLVAERHRRRKYMELLAG